MALHAFHDYKEFLVHNLEMNKERRGYHGTLAKAAGCHSSYLSQVVNGNVHFTPDHAAGIAHFLNFNSDDSDYFVTLVMHARAGVPHLRKILEARLEELKQKSHSLNHRLQENSKLSAEDENRYYSSWHIQAVHMLCMLPGLEKVANIAVHLGVGQDLVFQALQLLERVGFVVASPRGGWVSGPQSQHLPRHSPLCATHHLHWRNRANLSLLGAKTDALHYTALHTISKNDTEKLREMLVSFIEKSRKIVAPSKDEEAICVSLDLFKL